MSENDEGKVNESFNEYAPLTTTSGREGSKEMTASEQARRVSAMAVSEYKEIVLAKTKKEDIDHDVWGATMLVILKDLPDILAGHASLEQGLRCGFIAVAYLLNLGLQFMLCVWIMTKITLPSIRESQDIYSKFHQVAFEIVNGHPVFSKDLFTDPHTGMDPDEIERLCNFGISKRLFLYAILFLWMSQCMQELKNIERINRRIFQLPLLPSKVSPHDMCYEVKDGEESVHFEEKLDLIVALDRRTTFFLYVLILAPRLIICVLLSFLGQQWLIASEDSSDLMLNSLALVFVVDVDHLLYVVYLPARMDKALDVTKFAVPLRKKKDNETVEDFERELERQDIIVSFTRSFGYLIGTCLCVFLAVHFQVIFPGYSWDVRGACAQLETSLMPDCAPFSGGDCFPYR
jgi:hypothetical protein